jgi:putative membrane protein
MLIGFTIALGVTYFSPAEGSESLLWVFACGVIAISALILPGVSGSFILLMLGMYTVVRGAAEDAMRNQELSSLLILVAFVLGCGLGLLSFARIMSYAFKNYKNATLALLTGFMIGSLRKIWPWRNIDTVLDKETGEVTRYQEMIYESMDNLQVLREFNVLPQDYQGNAQSVLVVIAAVVGFGVIFLFQYIARQSK